MSNFTVHPASFKDPAGFVFLQEGKLFRQVNQSYANDYDLLIKSGLYDALTSKDWLIPHIEMSDNLTSSSEHYKTLIPVELSFTSYVYEWTFDMLKDAALLTLAICERALDHGMVLKDATPYNIQFYKGKPIFIDTLSFEAYQESKPWVAYRQFCEMFLFPLYLEHYLKTDINKLLATYINGIPADLVNKLLPFRSNFNMGVWLHIKLQNMVKQKPGNRPASAVQFDKRKFRNLLAHLKSIIEGFKEQKGPASTWSNYYDETILSKNYLQSKETIFRSFVKDINFDRALDLGANDGYFSYILAEKANDVIAADFDSKCVNALYNQMKAKEIKNILPVTIDLSNPSPAIGFNNTERQPFIHRAPSNMVTALALIHHLVFSKNVSLPLLAEFFKQVSNRYLIIEYIPTDDEKVIQIAGERLPLFSSYTQENFEMCFNQYFNILKQEVIEGSSRTLYLMQKKGAGPVD
jgi:hypothetical protein